jgi:ferritin-like protein
MVGRNRYLCGRQFKYREELYMELVSRQLVAKSGINVDELVKLLVANAAAELTTFYYYTILRVNLIGNEGEGLKEIAEDARIEDRNHFEALVPRIYELGGKLPDDMKAFHDMSACPPARLPGNPADTKAIMQVLLGAEQCAVKGYSHICDLTAGKDHRTHDLALAILNEEIEHEAWFAEFLGQGPSGHFRRRTVGESPFVSRFLHP